MAGVEIKVRSRSRLGKVARQLDDAMDKVARETAEFARDTARESMVGSGGGRVYLSGPPPLPHIASAPGRPPAIWTGHLFASIHTERKGQGHYVCDASAPYAKYLEYGTSTPMAPRPFMRPAARKAAGYARARGAASVRISIASVAW